MKRILFGGSFDPVHAGHVAIAEGAFRALGADRLTFVPAGRSPHKSSGPRASGEDRLAMLRLVAATVPGWDVTDVELRRAPPSYTIDTVLELLSGPFTGDSLMLLLGQDSLAELHRWRRAAELARLCGFAVVVRPDAPEPPWADLERVLGAEAVRRMRGGFLRLPPSAVSSSAVRARIAAGKSIRCWVPDPVADYIETRGLYR